MGNCTVTTGATPAVVGVVVPVVVGLATGERPNVIALVGIGAALARRFKAEGAKLSGTMSGPQGADVAISDGKVEGDSIAFTVKLEFNGNSMVRNYSGVVAGDEIKMKSQTQRGAQEFVAKRAK